MKSEYLIFMRNGILQKLDDLKTKIENDEDVPNDKQELELLVDIDDLIDSCLNN